MRFAVIFALSAGTVLAQEKPAEVKPPAVQASEPVNEAIVKALLATMHSDDPGAWCRTLDIAILLGPPPGMILRLPQTPKPAKVDERRLIKPASTDTSK